MSFKAMLGLLLGSFICFAAHADDEWDLLFGTPVVMPTEQEIYESWCDRETHQVMAQDSQGRLVVKFDCTKMTEGPFCKERVVRRFGMNVYSAYCTSERPL